MTARVEHVEPVTYEQAMASDTAGQWQQAMNDEEENESLRANQTWVLEELPSDTKTIPVKWIYKVRLMLTGIWRKNFKARLGAKGYVQREGIGFNEVFASASKYATLRTLLAFAATENFEAHQFDV